MLHRGLAEQQERAVEFAVPGMQAQSTLSVSPIWLCNTVLTHFTTTAQHCLPTSVKFQGVTCSSGKESMFQLSCLQEL